MNTTRKTIKTKVFAQNKYPRTSIPVQLARLLNIEEDTFLIWGLGRDQAGRYYLKVYKDLEQEYWKKEAKKSPSNNEISIKQGYTRP